MNVSILSYISDPSAVCENPLNVVLYLLSLTAAPKPLITSSVSNYDRQILNNEWQGVRGREGC